MQVYKTRWRHERLLTKSYREKWAPWEDTTCLTCRGGEETTAHIFLECPMAKLIWHHLAGCSELVDMCNTFEELWRAGRCRIPPGDKSAKGNIPQILIPTVI
ncbi:hypothetical protein QJS04_geneDACA007050 [Acorus gramineus]|uniref:Reverse transcriptase zinc-binding domain-containing protein n=1 Tax=Acorus gramineus TaxID=55184 RepID=A0AAV9BNI0_ACOGR|nr:hypothetical protein QJS04_geneDACA007050 [Acorus gramineus]